MVTVSARDKFEKGMRVTLSDRGAARLKKYSPDTMGTVVGFSRSPDCVRIVRDGHVTPDAYHMNFWEPA